MRRVLGHCFGFVVAASSSLFAAETGSISGVIRDSQGGVLPGASVSVSGPYLPSGRQALTSANGEYLFPRLLPGPYKVEVTLSGMGSASRETRVAVDVDTQVNLTLSPQAVAEEVTVTGIAPAVDLKNTEVNFNFTSEQIKELPLERSYRGLFQLIPGVAENRSIVGPSAGGSRQDNTYLIDGVNITNPGFGYLSTEVNELDVVEFNIKRGAISAEFGRSAGFVANAVTKSGTNQLAGSARFEFMPQSFISDFNDDANTTADARTFRDPLLTSVLNPAIGLGGPIVKDKVFFYASGRYFKETRAERFDQGGTAQPDEIRKGHELYGKLTATPTSQHLIAVSFRDRPNQVDNANIGPTTASSVATDDDNGSRIATGSWSFFPTQRTIVEVKYLYLKENNETVPQTQLGFLPTWNPTDIGANGQYVDPAQGNLTVGAFQYNQLINYRRKEIKATLGHFLDIGKTGHQLKVGGGYEFGEENLSRTANGWGTIANVTVSGQPRIRARYYPIQPPQLGQGRTYSFFAQDTMTVSRRLTLNMGVLLNKDEYAQEVDRSGGCPSTITLKGGVAVYETKGDRCTFLRFGFGDEIQPRFGINFNLRPDAGDKIYANYGRYYNMDQKSSGRSLAPGRIFQSQAIFDLQGALISDAPLASTTGKLIDPDLKPTYNDEILAGYATPFNNRWGIDVFYIHRNTKNFIEDVPSVLPDTGPYAAANLPCTRFASCQGAEGKRKYQSITAELNKAYANRWSLSTSYTYSKLEGNFDLDYSSAVFNTSSFIQDGPGTNVNEPFRYGRLREDRPHVFKLFGNYDVFSSLTVGGYLRVQSGGTWTTRARDWEGATLNYLEPAGSNRNPTWTNLDLLAAYRLRLNDTTNLRFEARVLNVFNNQTRLTTNAVKFLDLNTIDDPPFFAPYTQPNPFFDTGNSFAPPRRILLSALLNF